jgi:hypothetical protein
MTNEITHASWWQRHRFHLFAALIILLGGFLRFFTIGAKTVWLDEAFSIWVANQPIWEGWSWLIRVDQHPPLFYTLLSIWQSLFGDLQGTVRALSALFSTLTIPGLYLVGRRLTNDEYTGLLAALILAVAPFHVRFAQETRMYALLSCAAVWAIYFAIGLLQADHGRRLHLRDWFSPRSWRTQPMVGNAVGLALFQAAVMLTHNTATVFFTMALNLPVLGLWLFRRLSARTVSMPAVNQSSFLRNWLYTQLAALILWLPWAIPFVLQSIKVDQEFWLWSPSMREIINVLRNFDFAHFPGDLPWQPLMILYALLALGGLIALRRRFAWALLLLSLFLTPFVGELLVTLRRPIFYDRTLIWTNMAYYLLIALGIRSLGASFLRQGTESRTASGEYGYRPLFGPVALRLRLAPLLQGLLVTIIVAVSALALNGYYFHFQKEDWAKAADHVAASAQPGDMIIFNATWVQIPFEYYYRHYDLDTELRGLPTDLFDFGILEPKMMRENVPTLYDLIEGRERVWLVYSHDWYTDPERIIPTELDQSMQRVEQSEFIGLRVMQYEAQE